MDYHISDFGDARRLEKMATFNPTEARKMGLRLADCDPCSLTTKAFIKDNKNLKVFHKYQISCRVDTATMSDSELLYSYEGQFLDCISVEGQNDSL